MRITTGTVGSLARPALEMHLASGGIAHRRVHLPKRRVSEGGRRAAFKLYPRRCDKRRNQVLFANIHDQQPTIGARLKVGLPPATGEPRPDLFRHGLTIILLLVHAF